MRLNILTYLLIAIMALPASATPKHEIRATWITTLGGMDWPRQKANNEEQMQRQQKELCQILDSLQRANFNTVLFQTRLRGSVIYPSDIEPFAESLTGRTGKNPGYDPLQFAIDECHKRGMEIHAWIVAVPIGNNRQVNLLGTQSVVKKKRHICKQFKGSWYLDPGHPESADYLTSIVHEIIGRYDIDGIHLDYIRYPEQGERFPDNDTYNKYGKGIAKKEWRKENITSMVRKIYRHVKELKPWVKVSSSPVGKYADTDRYPSKGWNALHAVHQDVLKWLDEGIQDVIFPMMYFRDNDFYPFALDWKENSRNRWVVPGLGIYFLSPNEKNWPIEEIARQIYFTRQAGLSGQAYFRNRFLLDNTKGLLHELKYDFYRHPALLPPMTWADSIPPTAPTNPTYTLDSEGALHIRWESGEDNHPLPVAYHLYASPSYPVDTENAENLVRTYIKETEITLTDWQKNCYFAITCTDRYGNESTPLMINHPFP